MSNIIFKQIKKDLPDFPDEIIQDWLLPFGIERGWPPKEDTLGGVLMFGSIDYWRNVIWEKKQKKFNDFPLSPNYQSLINEIVLNYNIGRSSLPDSAERINSVIAYIEAKQKVPRPVVLISTSRGHDIVDGNHRLAACEIFINKTGDNIMVDAWVGLPMLPKDAFYWNSQI